MGAFSRFMRPKMKLFTVEFRRIMKFSACEFYRKCFGHIFPIYVSKNEAVCCGVQTHFESTLAARFTEKVLGALPRFVCPKMKRFAVKFRCILEIFAFQAL